jgi:MFS superfamily sulfate permease-like transporter
MQYLKVRSRHGWSPWPAYLLWPCLLAGVFSLVFGLFRL